MFIISEELHCADDNGSRKIYQSTQPARQIVHADDFPENCLVENLHNFFETSRLRSQMSLRIYARP